LCCIFVEITPPIKLVSSADAPPISSAFSLELNLSLLESDELELLEGFLCSGFVRATGLTRTLTAP
jgi:hypothetical protein